jgi:hypothetical protein
MTLIERQKIFTLNVSELVRHIFHKNFSCTYGEAWRPPEMAELYAQQGKGIKNSLHCYRLAVDLNIFDSHGTVLKTLTSDYQAIGDFWKSLHEENRWGGDYKKLVDLNHFEMNPD